jgi:3-hydroxyisobutyrate dehydrogenase
MLKVSTSRSFIMDYVCPLVFRGDFGPYFKLALACKDYGLAVAMGKEFGVSLPIASAVEQRFIEAKAAGLGEKGNHSLILLSEERAGVKVRSKEQR